MSHIGRNIVRYRKAEGLSAAELAEKAGEGLTRSVIANLENGRKDDVTVRQLVALSNALRVPPVALVLDLFTPGAPAPYPMPEYSGPAFDRKTLRKAELKSKNRVAEFRAWFTGEQLFMQPPVTGAPELVSGALNALRGYHRAWGQLVRAIAHKVDLGEITPADDIELQHEEGRRIMAAIEAAVDVVRWSRELTAKKVEHGDIENDVDELMRRAGIPFDFDTDSAALPDYSAIRWQ